MVYASSWDVQAARTLRQRETTQLTRVDNFFVRSLPFCCLSTDPCTPGQRVGSARKITDKQLLKGNTVNSLKDLLIQSINKKVIQFTILSKHFSGLFFTEFSEPVKRCKEYSENFHR